MQRVIFFDQQRIFRRDIVHLAKSAIDEPFDRGLLLADLEQLACSIDVEAVDLGTAMAGPSVACGVDHGVDAALSDFSKQQLSQRTLSREIEAEVA